MRTLIVLLFGVTTLGGCADFRASQPDTLVGGQVVSGDSYSPGYQPDLEILNQIRPDASVAGGEVVKGDSYSPGFQPDLIVIQHMKW